MTFSRRILEKSIEVYHRGFAPACLVLTTTGAITGMIELYPEKDARKRNPEQMILAPAFGIVLGGGLGAVSAWVWPAVAVAVGVSGVVRVADRARQCEEKAPFVPIRHSRR